MARFHTKDMIEYGTNVVGGVVPGKSGEKLRVCNTVKDAVKETERRPVWSLCRHPLPLTALWKLQMPVSNTVCITDGIPAQDMSGLNGICAATQRQTHGPNSNCAGTIGPQGATWHHAVTFTLKAMSGLWDVQVLWVMRPRRSSKSWGCQPVGIGDPINGSSFKDILERFEKDDQTEVIAMIGEIGGPQEAEAAEYIRDVSQNRWLPIWRVLPRPKGVRWDMPARSFQHLARAFEKVEILSAVGVTVENPAVIGNTIAGVMR